MNKETVLNFDDVSKEFYSTHKLMLPPLLTSDEVQAERDKALLRALARFSDSAEGTVGSEYRFRAECQFDADLFMHAISAYVECRWTIIPDDSGYHLPDVGVRFRLTRPIRPRSLLWAANTLVDGHVIAQTLALAEHYTGVRDMDLNPDAHCVELLPSEDEMRQMSRSSSDYAERLQCLAYQAEKYADGIFEVMATAYTSQAPANDDTDRFEGMLKRNA